MAFLTSARGIAVCNPPTLPMLAFKPYTACNSLAQP